MELELMTSDGTPQGGNWVLEEGKSSSSPTTTWQPS
jgi:hypothetical protein